MGLCFEKKVSKTSLLGEGFAFSKGVEPDGKSEISVFRFSQQWTDRSLNQVIAAQSTFNMGLDMGGVTINKSGPDGKFFFLARTISMAEKTVIYGQPVYTKNRSESFCRYTAPYGKV